MAAIREEKPKGPKPKKPTANALARAALLASSGSAPEAAVVAKADKPKAGGRVKKSLDEKIALGKARSEISSWNDDTTLDSELSALYLGISENALAELPTEDRRASEKAGEVAGPPVIKIIASGAKGRNQPVQYKLRDLREYQRKIMAPDRFQAVVNSGMAGWCANRHPFFAELEARKQPMILSADAWDMARPDREQLFESLADKKLRVVWLTPLDASARRWSDLNAHRKWADQTLRMLAEEASAVSSAIEATEMSSEL
jgi:hypothetical protein